MIPDCIISRTSSEAPLRGDKLRRVVPILLLLVKSGEDRGIPSTIYPPMLKNSPKVK